MLTLNQVLVQHTKSKSILTTGSKLRRSISPLKRSHFQPTRINKSLPIRIIQNQVVFGPHTKPKSILTPAQKTSKVRSWRQDQVNFDPVHKNQVKFDTITEIKLILIPTLMLRRFRFPDTKTQLVSIRTLKPSHFRPQHNKPSQSRSITLMWSNFRQPIQQLNPFHPTLE